MGANGTCTLQKGHRGPVGRSMWGRNTDEPDMQGCRWGLQYAAWTGMEVHVCEGSRPGVCLRIVACVVLLAVVSAQTDAPMSYNTLRPPSLLPVSDSSSWALPPRDGWWGWVGGSVAAWVPAMTNHELCNTLHDKRAV